MLSALMPLMKIMMTPLTVNEVDPVRLWAEIHLLREALKGPDGFDTWKDAAVAERLRRVAFQGELQALRNHVEYWFRTDRDFDALKRADDALKNC